MFLNDFLLEDMTRGLGIDAYPVLVETTGATSGCPVSAQVDTDMYYYQLLRDNY